MSIIKGLRGPEDANGLLTLLLMIPPAGREIDNSGWIVTSRYQMKRRLSSTRFQVAIRLVLAYLLRRHPLLNDWTCNHDPWRERF